ncbi:MAG: creatininase family protein [Chloroflexi bacterium]|nr:creatininase family protein [Chloroflexota bacterium]
MEKKKYLWWHELPAPELTRFAREVSDIAILPIGAIEQHGPHSPCGVDAFNARGMAELIAQKTDVMLLPWMWYGSHPYHHWYMPGTIPLSYDTHIALLVDIIQGASVSGFNKFIILSAHGQVSTTLVAVHKLGLAGHFTLSLHWYDFLRDNKDVLDDYMWHADEAETSVGLYLYPQYIDMSKAEKGGGEALIDKRFIIAPGQMPKPGMMYHFEGTFARPEYKELPNGVIGDPTKATLEKGEVIVTRVVNHIVELIEDIKTRWPVGTKPPVK